MRNADKKEGILLWLFAFCLTTFTLSGIVLSPGHQMPELGADGGKNLFTFLYQVLYGKGYWFTGMNYPYGEHIVYTDGQPIVSVLLSSLPGRLSLNSALSVMWWLVAFSWMLGIIFCYRILRQFAVRPLLAGVFSGLTIVLSPQMLRLSGHYALSWVCFIPMLFYFTQCYSRGAGARYLWYLLLTGLVATFLHPYYAAVMLIWAGCYAAGHLLVVRNGIKTKLLHVAGILLPPIAVLLVFGTVMSLTDPLHDRPVMPYGILSNCVHIKHIVSSAYSPFWAVFSGTAAGSHIPAGGEGYTYIGLAAIAALLLTAWLLLRRQKHYLPFAGADGFSPLWLVMAGMALLFSMGAPFAWHLEWLLDYASFFRQFRTLGRFAWISYYILAIYAAVFIAHSYNGLKQAGKSRQAILFLTLSLFVWEVEAWGYVTHIHRVTAKGAANYREFAAEGNTWADFLSKHGYSGSHFQAVLVLPFFETGSEKLWVCSNENTSALGVAAGIRAGLQLHLPVMDGMMSRTSWQVAFRQVRLAGGPYTKKELLNDVNPKPFLLLCLDGIALDPDQQYLVNTAETIGHYGNVRVFACYPGRIRAQDSSLRSSLPAHTTVADSCVQGSGPWASQYNGDGCFDGRAFIASDTQLAHLKIAIDTARLYEFSAWFRVSVKNYYSPDLTLEAIDRAGKVIGRATATTRESTDNHGLWLRCNAWFTLPAGTRTVRCTRQYPEIRSYEEVGDIMLRPDNSVISTHNGSCLNNHWVGQ